MVIRGLLHRACIWLIALMMGGAVVAKAQTPPAPTVAAQPATLTQDQDPVTDPAGVTGATPAAKKGDAPPPGSLTVPNSFTGLSTGVADSKGNFKPYAG